VSYVRHVWSCVTFFYFVVGWGVGGGGAGCIIRESQVARVVQTEESGGGRIFRQIKLPNSELVTGS
jgi:hypothetical protein